MTGTGWKDYQVHECPPWHICVLTAIQQVLSTMSGPLANVHIIWSYLCAPNNNLLHAELLSTVFFLSGVCTLIQTALGIRLPIVQGSSSAFISVIIASMSTPQWKCPSPTYNETSNSSTVAPNPEDDEAWKPRLMVLSGSLCVASVVEFVLGCTGAIGFLMRFIGPITILTTVSLIGLSLYPSAISSAQHQWGIAIMVVGLIIIFGFMLNKVQVPFPCYRRSKGCYAVTYPIFKLFPHMLATGLAWILSYILTITDVFPSDPEALQYKARTDTKTDVIHQATWWFFPYPGHWGLPTISGGIFAGMLAAVITSIIESVGDYYATASIARVRSPPKHAINRGIALEGFGGILAGLLGAGHATTSYSSVEGFIAITGIRSRVVWHIYGVLMLICGCIGKVGAALSIVPDPILGGLIIVGYGMLVSVGLTNLRYVDATSSRTMIIVGVSILLGMMLPSWLADNPGIINTGNLEVDQLLTVMLGTSMFVGGVIACFLDNIIPGTAAERGFYKLNESPRRSSDEDFVDSVKLTYDLPYVSDAMRRVKCCTYVPFLPSYVERKSACCRKDKKVDPDTDQAWQVTESGHYIIRL